jgi:hypothetical protein
VLVESRASHLAQEQNADPDRGEVAAPAADVNADGDLVKLNGKPKKATKPSTDDAELF